jgi:predicted porin
MRNRNAILALCAFAAASPAVLAAPSRSSGVSLYGLVDAGIHDSNRGPAQLGTIQRSYIGVRGEEDLGGGLAATFHLQHRFDVDTGLTEASGARPFFYGESTVGLRGGFGALRFGRALTPMWAHDWAFDPWANFDRIASPAWQIFHPSYRTEPHHNGPIGDYSRLNNGIFYDSPTFGGLAVHAAVGVEKDTTPDANGLRDSKRALGASLNYERGPFAAMLAGERNSADDRTWFAGASWRLGATTVMGSYSQTSLSDESLAFLGDTSARRRAVTLGLTHVSGANTWKLGWGRDFEGYGTAGATHHVGFGVGHALSKRTTVYADLGLADPANAPRATRWGVGISHAF